MTPQQTAHEETGERPGAVFNGAHDALNRMKRAYERRTGCNLTAEMIQSLHLTVFGEMWSEDDPRTLPTKENPQHG